MELAEPLLIERPSLKVTQVSEKITLTEEMYLRARAGGGVVTPSQGLSILQLVEKMAQ